MALRTSRRRAARGRPALALLAGLVGAAAVAAEDGYLFSIPLDASARVDAHPPSGPLDVTLRVADPDRAAALVERGGALLLLHRSNDRITVRATRRPVLAGGPADAHLAASFVIDYDEAPVEAAHDQLVDAAGTHPAPAAIGRFVAEYIADKSYEGHFDFASRVAARRSGDCTEHAVLAAALARAAGRPARVILGVVIVETATGPAAFGHAWTEMHTPEGWELVDATGPGDDTGARYLPLIALDDEGPGYALDMMRLAAVHPARITLGGTFEP